MKCRENLSGEIINGKKILGIAGMANDKYHTLYYVECPKCKKKYVAPKSNILRTKTCSNCCPRTRLGPENIRWKGGKFIPLDYYHSLERNAYARGISFSLSIQFLETLYLHQEQKCALTNEPIDFLSKTASLDRIDPTKNYVKGNVQWVCKDVNQIKNTFSQPEFINYCIGIHQYTHVPKPVYGIPKCPLVDHKNFRGVGYIGKDKFTSIQREAKERNLEFDVSVEDLNEQFKRQGGRCNLTGTHLFFTSRKSIGNASLDRIDNLNGYISNNIQWVHKDINFIKYTLSTKRLLEICKKITKKFTPVVAVSGYFQILHAGHINYITDARKHGGYLIAIINSDKQASLKSTPCVVDEKSREYIVSRIRGVDETIIAIDDDATVAKTIEMIKPNIFCNGGDRIPSNASEKEQKICESLGIKMIYNVGGGKSDSSSGILCRAHEMLSKI